MLVTFEAALKLNDETIGYANDISFDENGIFFTMHAKEIIFLDCKLKTDLLFKKIFFNLDLKINEVSIGFVRNAYIYHCKDVFKDKLKLINVQMKFEEATLFSNYQDIDII